MNDKNRKLIRWILLIAWMIVIFIFSQLPGDVSDEQSKLVIYIFNVLGLDLNSHLGNLANFVVRKGAHFTEYFILYILTLNVLRLYMDKRKAWNYSLAFVFLYACSDEFHQSFVPGRGPAFRDVLIDTSGGAFAYIVTSVINRFKIGKK